jgi:hypothetical protein
MTGKSNRPIMNKTEPWFVSGSYKGWSRFAVGTPIQPFPV